MTFYQNPYTMSLKEVVVRRAGTIVALGGQQLQISPMVVGGTLRGNSKILSTNSYIEGAELTVGAAGWPMNALPVMLGIPAISPTGSAPNRSASVPIPAGSALPYFEVAGRAQSEAGGDVHVYVPMVKILSNFSLQIQDGANFVAPSFSAQAIPDGSDMPFYLIPYETTTAVANSFPAGSSASISALVVADGVATATSTAHGFGVGQWVTIAGATEQQTIINGLKQIIAVPDADTFTFAAIGAADDAVGISGTITAIY